MAVGCPLVDASVIIPSYRGEQRIRPLLDALAAQTYEGPWEVVVSVDGALDQTSEVVDEYADRLTIQCLVAAAPKGVTHALNAGFAAAKGRVLIRCDDDFTPSADMVLRHVNWHQPETRIGVNCVYRDVDVDSPFGRSYGSSAAKLRRDQWYNREPVQRWIDWAGHNSITREVWEELGSGFDPRFRYGQDSELGWRIAQLGVEIVVDPALEIEHRGAPVSAANRIPRGFIAGASRRLFTHVHGASHAEAAAQSQRPSVWGALTYATSRVLRSEAAYRRLGVVVERALPIMPTMLRKRLIAWALESAARAGEAFGPDDLYTIGAQKDREVATERGPLKHKQP